MLFEKKMDPRCAYCRNGAPAENGDVICRKKGIVSPAFSCRAFRYDPLRRVPPRPAAPDFSGLRAEDFKL